MYHGSASERREIVFYLFNNVFKSGYATSLFFLSLIINFISLPLYNIAESWQAKERAIQEKMKPMIDNIKAVYKGDQRYLLIRTCQRINGYKTIYAFRGTLGLLIHFQSLVLFLKHSLMCLFSPKPEYGLLLPLWKYRFLHRYQSKRYVHFL